MQRGNLSDATRDIRGAAVTKALPLFLLDHLCARLETPPRPYVLEGSRTGSLAASIGNALCDADGVWRRLFTEYPSQGPAEDRVKAIFAGDNIHGQLQGARLILVKADYLSADCFDIVWRDLHLNGWKEIHQLTELFRKVWNLPPPTPFTLPEPDPEAEVKETKTEGTAKPTEKAKEKETPDYFAKPSDSKNLLFGKIPPKPAGEAQPPEKPLTLKFAPDVEPVSTEFASQVEPDYPKIERVVPKRIDPSFFQIHNPNHYIWEDSEPLLNFGLPESDQDIWRIRDACEGVAIFGAVGSGKTSGSGSALSRAFLQAGFGGLVLTVKPDEAARWERLCRETGRECDFIHVTPSSGHKLNFLQYELERPGERLAVTDDLIALFRTLIGVMSRRKGTESGDDFWTNTTNQLIRKLTDIFLLAGEPLTLDRMVHFITQAPKSLKQEWQYSEMFAEVIQRAEARVQDHSTREDRRIFRECYRYWTDEYPAITDVTRSGFITAFSAMADVLSGRGIHEMTGTDTNLTPEMMLSGKVVVLDIPLKGNVQGGMMIQSMWKLLFQQAVERREDKGKDFARPAFLWEDEGHMFFSQHDVKFQPTSRDCRAPHVVLSQNLHNFYEECNQHSVEAVFAAMNTLLFHTNGDMTTNKWASEKIGDIRHLKLTTDGLLRPMDDKEFTFFERRPEEVKSVGKLSIAEEQKRGLPPEDFAKLKRGGDGTCEAVLIWLSHQFAANHNRNFCVLTFAQEPRQNRKLNKIL